MRLWSIHPRYLDRQGLTALWREGLLARAVLAGKTRGYTRHPQLERFQAQPDPLQSMDVYLWAVQQEASRRGYRFDGSKLGPRVRVAVMRVQAGQVAFEWEHLRRKLEGRSPEVAAQWLDVAEPDCHPLFRRVQGPVATWERGAGR